MLTLVPETNDTQREAQARRRARKRGWRLAKSRTREPAHASYGSFMLIDAATNVVVAGSWPYDFSLALDDVEDHLKD